MKKQYLKTVILAAALAGPLNAMGQVATPTHTIQQTFTIPSPDYKLSPYTGMTRQSWIDAAEYLLSGAFTYIRTLDDPMYFPKQLDKAYPNNEGQVPTAKLEGFCRTLFVAAPLLREKPELTLNGIKVADYYRHQLLNLIRPDSPSFIPHRKGGPSQILVEFGALAISLSVAKDILWEPLTQEQKDQLAATMLSYGNGPTIGSNWMFFNVFVISFFKEQGYAVNDQRMKENLEKILKLYRGEGWYNDAPAYDYYSMWAFQMYGPIWAQMYGHFYPEYAAQFMKNQHDLADNYPYMFSAEGKMNMWGRSIPYRFGAVVPLALLGYEKAPDINYGWMRRIASATLLQFLQNPDFLEDNVPTLGFYGTFAPAVQIYSCRGSVYWCGKAFLSLLLPADNPFWTAVENNGPWEKEFKKDHVYNKFQPATNLLITDYPNCGGAEMRSWCHETVANDWQKFRSSENYNKLAYHTEFPWMADGTNGEVSMNYATLNGKNQWEVLRLYTFQTGTGGGHIFSGDAKGDVLGPFDTVVAFGDLVFQHPRVFRADAVEAVIRLGDIHLVAAPGAAAAVDKGKLERQRTVKIIQPRTPAAENGRLILGGRNGIVDVLIFQRFCVDTAGELTNAVWQHPHIGNGLLGRYGRRTITGPRQAF